MEVAIDVDNFTYSTYNNVGNATDWALAQMAGVSAIYTQELGGLFLLQATYVHLWQTPDPMSNFTNNASGMLDNFRSTWETTPSLDAVQRDVTHLMSKRGNTGTGGIAYLGVNCSSFAYGFSAVMTSSTTTNINSYSWNLDVVSHELGHNFGSNTHWCGWPGGPIDDCYPSEGGCANGPQVSTGTIMSYCHLDNSTPKVLQFHPTVESNALIPSMNASGCYTFCEEYEPPVCAITDIEGGCNKRATRCPSPTHSKLSSRTRTHHRRVLGHQRRTKAHRQQPSIHQFGGSSSRRSTRQHFCLFHHRRDLFPE